MRERLQALHGKAITSHQAQAPVGMRAGCARVQVAGAQWSMKLDWPAAGLAAHTRRQNERDAATPAMLIKRVSSPRIGNQKKWAKKEAEGNERIQNEGGTKEKEED